MLGAPGAGTSRLGPPPHHHPARHDPGGSPRAHAPPPRRRLTGARTALVTARPCRAPPQTIAAVGLIDGGHVPIWARCHERTMASSAWMNCRSAAARSWRPGANPLKMVLQEDNLAGVLDLNTFADFALRVMAVKNSDEGW